MKSFLVVLPLAGLALAQECSQSTVTETFTNTLTVTVPAVPSSKTPCSSSSVDAIETVVSTIFVTPSPAPSRVPVVPGSLSWPYNNITFNYTNPPLIPTLSTVSFELFTTSAVESEATTAAPVEATSQVEPSYPAETAAPSSEPAAIPTSESPVPSSAEAPALSSYSQFYTSMVTPSASATPAAAAASTVPVNIKAANKGQATFYGGNVAGGMCSFSGYTIPSGIFGTALSDSNWSNAANCGACVSVTGPSGNAIKAMIVDQCPGCGSNHLDLFPDAFAKLAQPSKGVIDVAWTIVPCGITSPIVLKNKEGTSKFWFSMQVMNSNVPVSKLEVSVDGGKTWKATTRQPYNFFENSSGFGADTVDVRVTSTSGSSIVVKSVSIAANSKATAGSNFSS